MVSCMYKYIIKPDYNVSHLDCWLSQSHNIPLLSFELSGPPPPERERDVVVIRMMLLLVCRSPGCVCVCQMMVCISIE